MGVPEYPNDRSLLSLIFINADEKAYDGAKDFLERMGLPNAEDGEYFSGPNVSRLYLPEGLSVSFLHRNVNPLAALWSRMFPGRAVENARVYAGRKLKDPEVLQPLYQEDLSANCCVEIVPGTPRAKITRDALEQMGASLAKRNIDFYTRSEDFVGVVRKDGEEARLVTNRRSVRPLKGNKPSGNENIGLQEKVYGGLRAEFRAALGSGSAERIRGVLRECAAIAACPDSDPNKVLYPYWKAGSGSNERANKIAASATNYARRLAAS